MADISPVGLALAAGCGERAGVRLRTLEIDLEQEPFPPGPWDLIVCVRFLWRPLFAVIPDELAPGGILVVVHPTRSNLLRHERPGLHHLLEDGELPGLVQGLEIVNYEEGWTEEGQHEARLVARRPASATGGSEILIAGAPGLDGGPGRVETGLRPNAQGGQSGMVTTGHSMHYAVRGRVFFSSPALIS